MSAKYVRLANILREEIQSNNHNAGKKLPTEQALSSRYGVSRQTVRQALNILLEEELIFKKQGSGTYIADRNADEESKQIYILVSADNEYTYPALIRDIKTNLEKNNYTVATSTTDDRVDRERELLSEIIKSKPAGIIIEAVKSAYPNPNLDIYEKARNLGISIMFIIGKYTNFPDYPFVGSDDIYGGYMLIRALSNKKHKNIASILQRDSACGIERYQGIVTAKADNDCSLLDDLNCFYDYSDLKKLREKQDTKFLSDFLDKIEDKSTAIICMSDEIAYWIIRILRQRGTNAPDDLSVVSFDNSYLSTFGQTGITSLSHGAHEMGRNIANGMIRLISNSLFSSTKLSWHIVNRDSDGECKRKI